jgi:superfamily I DNA/RNA helicase
MNWLCSFLDRYTLISNSDAHSPEKLGREANLFFTELSYKGIIEALKKGDNDKFLGTIEFFPEEGKYHFDGHRKCGISWTPEETVKYGGICPVCGKEITVGVLNRVIQLKDRKDPYKRSNRHPFYSLTSLKNLIAEIKRVGPKTKEVSKFYESIIKKGGSEFSILLEHSYDRIKEIGGEIIAEGIRRLRNREVYIKEGFDGEFGTVNVFKQGEIEKFSPQISIFKDKTSLYPTKKKEIKPEVREDLLTIKNYPLKEKTKEKDLTLNKIQNLNTEQDEAKNHFLGPCLILAGPGTGKTFTLTMRVIHLVVNKKVAPSNILAITFTNRAKEEMEKRITRAFSERKISNLISIFTFHSFGLSILKRYAEVFGRNYPFSIFGEDETRYILRFFLGISKKEIEDIKNKIKTAKNSGFGTSSFEDERFSQIYEEYEKFLKKENAFDIDDLILYPVRLFHKREEIIKLYRGIYKFICVDEYQDINQVQYQLIRLLAQDKDANICVIGDPDQAIYAFRGANVKFIQNFREDYPEARIYKMKKSYRCSNIILKASSQIKGSGDSPHLNGLYEGVGISIKEFPSNKSEAEFVARTIEKMMGGVRFFSIDSNISDGQEDYGISSFSDFAVLFRTSKIAEYLQGAMEDHGIPYQFIGEKLLFKKEPVSSIIDVLHYIIEPENKIWSKKLKDKNIRGVAEGFLNSFNENIQSLKIREIIDLIIKECFKKTVLNKTKDLDQLFSLASFYSNNLEEFLSSIHIDNAQDAYNPKIDKVTLMTIHAAKGLEFPCVFIIGCEEGILPYTIFENQKSDPEEERKLFYVGMTRAKHFLYLTHVKKRYLFGRVMRLALSSFVKNINDELLNIEDEKVRKKEKEDKQLSLFT